jgi:23S rRNA (uracil747-C5)-methyltransferase
MKTFCSYYNQGVCKSCELITLDYADQIKAKEEHLIALLAAVNATPLLPSAPSSPWHFRNKAKLVVTGSLEDPILGLWGEADLDVGRELLTCPLHLTAINEMLPPLKKFIQLAKLAPYQISSKKGELKGLILFHSPATQESYLRFVLRSQEGLDRIKKNLSVLTTELPHVKCISANIQPIPHAILEGEEEIFFTDKISIQHQLGDIHFSLGPRAFVQTNQEVAQKLYQTAASWVKDSGLESMMELYCGQGAFSFFCAPHVTRGLGIEINPDAIAEANRTAELYSYHHLKFISADAGKVSQEIKAFHPEIMLVNPPRRGLAEASELLLKEAPEMIIYSSCNAQTLANDLKKLGKQYEVTKVQLFDMFPHTKHFETLVELRAIKTI